MDCNVQSGLQVHRIQPTEEKNNPLAAAMAILADTTLPSSQTFFRYAWTFMSKSSPSSTDLPFFLTFIILYALPIDLTVDLFIFFANFIEKYLAAAATPFHLSNFSSFCGSILDTIKIISLKLLLLARYKKASYRYCIVCYTFCMAHALASAFFPPSSC